MEPIRVLSLFSGIGAFEKALTRLGIPFEIINYCEIDPYPSKAYSIIHNIPEEKNLWDVKKIDLKKLPDFDLLTWGFPCTDVSVAGKSEGLKLKCNDCGKEFNLAELIDGSCPYCLSGNVESNTRSGLYFEGYKVLLAKKPKYSVIENVKGLINKKNKKSFQQILKDLEDAGYNNYWKVLNAKDFGVPQNRERVFIVSIRKDIKQDFEFPIGFDSGIRLKHILEPVVDEKYYIPQERCERLLNELKSKIKIFPNNIIQLTNPSFSQQRIYSPKGNAPTIAAGNNGGGKEPCKIIEFYKTNDNKNPKNESNNKILQVGMIDIHGNEQVRRVYNPEGLAPTLNTMQGGHRQPKIIVCDIYKKHINCNNPSLDGANKLLCIGNIYEKKSEQKDKKIKQRQGYRIYSPEGIACTQVAKGGGLGGATGLYAVYDPYNGTLPKDQEATTLQENYSNGNIQLIYVLRIRKLTPLECFLLMGFDREDFKKLREYGFSDTRLYKMAGNSIVVNVLEHIFKELFLKNDVIR